VPHAILLSLILEVQAIRRSFRAQPDGNRHNLTTEWEVQLATPEVVSIVHTTTDYTGGFHNGIEIGVLNIVRTDTGWRELTLAIQGEPGGRGVLPGGSNRGRPCGNHGSGV
ncbi:MAG: hypothetical protein KIS67_28505, partial [Verrucomicrobiae bacterium]|nr:hypothetical protein [Verrucomicrobiae bacterium]